MRRREEQRRKFHEALINMLYPPPPEPSPPSLLADTEWNEDDEPANLTPQEIPDHESDVEKIPDDDGGGGEREGKLTRAQRKRLRKRKLKEDSSRRGKLIGPLLPVTVEEDVVDDPQGVRQNVTLSSDSRVENKASTLGDGASSGSGKKKLKQRRKGRKLARTTLESADAEKLIGDAEGGGRSSSSSETQNQS